MSWNYLKQAVNVGCYTLSGFSLYYLINSENFKTVQNSFISDIKPSEKWNENWDFRDVKHKNEQKEKLEKRHANSQLRHIFLIRHGQYNLNGLSDKDRKLTELGREQAKLTGDRLKELKIPITDFVLSTMTRAQETGNIILGQLDNVEKMNIKHDSIIEEGAPIPPEPKVGHWRPQHYFFVDGSRIEAAFRKYFHRADPAQKEDSYTVLVCHANVIRYFVCRALQIPPEAWLRMSLHHGSITWLVIHPSGRVVLRLLGDCGHIPKKSLSTK